MDTLNNNGSIGHTYQPVQAATVTEGRGRSKTELARIAAAHSKCGWRFDDGDKLVDADGETVAWTIEDAAEAMDSLGWIKNHRVDWSQIPSEPSAAADQLRGQLKNGIFPGRPLV